MSLFTRNGWYLGEEGHLIPNNADEDLMVWMRVASLPNFRKRFRLINSDLPIGSYQLRVNERFDVSAFQGQKLFVMATSSWIGGKNYILGILYACTGTTLLLFAIAFGVKRALTPTRMALH